MLDSIFNECQLELYSYLGFFFVRFEFFNDCQLQLYLTLSISVLWLAGVRFFLGRLLWSIRLF